MAKSRSEPAFSASAAQFSAAQYFVLFAGLALATLPHTERMPWWVNCWIAVLLLWRIQLVRTGGTLPRRLWLVLLAIGAVLCVMVTYRTIFGRDAGVTLLVLLISLKLLEMTLMRDVVIVVFLAYFVSLTGFFYSQSMPAAVLMVVTVLVMVRS